MITIRLRHGITLMELVATSAAVALAAALLAPAVADVSRRGKDTICLQNLARIAQASIVYAAADEHEQAVPVHPQVNNQGTPPSLRRATAAYAWGGKSGRGQEGSDLFFWGTGRAKGPATRPLNEILYGDVFPDYSLNPGPDLINWIRDSELDLSVYRCPSDNGYTGIHYTAWADSKLTSYDHYGTSYAASALWIYIPGANNCPGGGGGSCCASDSPYGHRLSEIVDPAQTLYYLENCARYAFLNGTVDTSCDTASQDVVEGWHGQPWLFNAAFVDGHAAPIHLRGYRNPHLGHYPEREYNYWHCVIIRGDDWQLDTLPLEPVLTNIECGS
ncbi:MAG: hypothetical protein ACYSUI_11575 [Planctomycetota bacterium]|jgi:prepilin-type processing-associated H-X9-DG protein